jgi:glycine oxidase
MPDTYDVAIVGGGAAGSAAAYYLAKAGVKTVVIERDGVAAHASGYSAGGLNPLQGVGIPGPLGPLAIESYRMHLDLWDPLMSESGVDFAPGVISVVRVAFDDSELPELRETLRLHEAADGFSAGWLDAGELHRLEPGLSPEAIQGVYTHGNAALDSYLYTVALARAAERLGAEARPGEVTGVKRTGDRVTSVLVHDGEILCDTLVLAMGPWSTDAEAWLGVKLPVNPLRGEILRTELPGQAALAHDLSGPGVSLHSRRGLVWIGTTEESRGFDVEPSEATRRSLMASAAKLMPAMADARLVKHTVCLRPVTPDWLPVLGRAPGWSNVYLATGAGKKGILISPGMGKAVADLITSGRTELPIGPFAPERFGGTQTA